MYSIYIGQGGRAPEEHKGITWILVMRCTACSGAIMTSTVLFSRDSRAHCLHSIFRKTGTGFILLSKNKFVPFLF
jgi:hypothetical protein